MNIAQINCIDRNSKTVCPIGWKSYSIDMSYKIDNTTINIKEKVFALNGSEASKYGLLYLENIGVQKLMKMRIDKN